ncbi:MAG: tetratricopeptide repeat protein [Planctomycetota bacterium]|jgi:tetratricopeptide (TPR) repeat protein
MLRPLCGVLLLLAPLAGAEESYESLLLEADRLYRAARPGNAIPQRLDDEYAKLAEAALLAPDRWEAFFHRGLNRCRAVFFMRGIVKNRLARLRAEGAPKGLLAQVEAAHRQFIVERMREAQHNFGVMELRMRERGQHSRDRILFANASIKFARREFLEAQGGRPGAVEDFKALIQRKYLPERCGDHIALCYMDLGAEAYRDGKYGQAQQLWSEGLRWTKQPNLRRMIYTNRAGAYGMDNEYGRAENLLREQIREEPHRPIHHKNLGLMLGFQNRLRESLYHYRRARELCVQTRGGLPLMLLNGNAWMRAAVIHGKLLIDDGDLRLAWRLFLEYRAAFGDDYNFCLWFGDFAIAVGQYTLAWRYLEAARDLQPHCTASYHKLLEIAPRTDGTMEEVKARIEASKASAEAARKRYEGGEESPEVQRVCGGLGDIGDVGTQPRRAPLLDPDPLAGTDVANPPAWLVAAADAREPFEPWLPPAAAAAEEDRPATAEEAAPAASGSWVWAVGLGVAVLLLLGMGVALFRRRAPA